MKKYSADNWRKLGRRVYQARIRAGYTDTQTWADAVGRSTRMLLGLERGEAVGNGTLDLVAAALEWTPEEPYEVLEGLELADAPPVPLPGEGGSVSAVADDGPEFEFLTRVREDLTDEEMDQLMKEATPYLQMLMRDIKARRD
ncbi:hypothetical protein [Aeromicrobium sp. 9AM]|uniref:hypothetical protein n=1 Tax=Aeromicrobium sp. 9AM TaxID=2653126 RepID=UPI0012F3CC43|nr:hypothetical protein [Aeromicrobium sp. 9AM]VXB83489.1 hypothetical protein AERO9AM_21020 [Aeromicrobium sp. 9AM]